MMNSLSEDSYLMYGKALILRNLFLEIRLGLLTPIVVNSKALCDNMTFASQCRHFVIVP